MLFSFEKYYFSLENMSFLKKIPLQKYDFPVVKYDFPVVKYDFSLERYEFPLKKI
jgi:hypothetical protein